jgi:hypothetical protein
MGQGCTTLLRNTHNITPARMQCLNDLTARMDAGDRVRKNARKSQSATETASIMFDSRGVKKLCQQYRPSIYAHARTLIAAKKTLVTLKPALTRTRAR